ncbi:hypothetical protein ACFWBG_22105 [Nocardia salmonicida]|uniref:hypothetical protein n=1 Tax=Nocardia salmonicida TaxID=53431 RepID=UPI00366CCF65
MAKFEAFPINLGGDSGGALLYLAKPTPVEICEALNGGVTVTAAPLSRVVLVQGFSSKSYSKSISFAVEKANEALDLLSSRGGNALTLAEHRTQNAAWWNSGNLSTMRLCSTFPFGFSMTAEIEARDSNGNLVPPSPMTHSPWHQSMRYFRMSQTTADLFDAFRNIYLALESILSTIEPVQVNSNGKPEGEGIWLNRALTTIMNRNLVNLHSYVNNSSSNPVDDVLSSCTNR